MNTNELLDAVKNRYSITSDYKLSKFLGISHSRVSNWRHGHNFLGEEVAIKIAEKLEMDAGAVFAMVQAERENRPAVKKVWQEAARKLGAASLLVVVGTVVILTTSSTTMASIRHQLIHYAK